MQFDNIKLANISLDVAKIQPEHKRAMVLPMLVPVLEKLAAKKLGKWNIVGTDTLYKYQTFFDGPIPEDVAVFHKFAMYEDGERLGTIGIVSTYRKHKRVNIFCLHSTRINKSRGLRETMETTKEDVAIRTALKYFVPTSMDEIINREVKVADATYRELRSHAHNKLSRITAHSELLPTFVRYAHENLGAFEKFVEENGVRKQYDASLFEDVIRNFDIVDSVAKYETAVVVLVNSQLHIITKNEQGEEVKQVFDEDDPTIPEHVRGRVGLLKLSQNGQVVENVGVRISDSTFTIIN